MGGRHIGYEIAEGEKPGYFYLYRVVRCGDAEHRTLIDVRCDRKRIEEVARLWQQPGAWTNFF